MFSKSFDALAGAANHLIGNIQPNHLPEALGPIRDQPGQQARGPAGAATQVKHPLAGAQAHAADSLFGDVEMMALHLLAFPGIRPAIEFLLQLFVRT